MVHSHVQLNLFYLSLFICLCPSLSPSLCVCLLLVSSFMSVSVFLISSSSPFLSLSLSLSHTCTHGHTCTQQPHTCWHTQFSISSHPATPLTHLTGQFDCATPQRDTALRNGDTGQGSPHLVPAAPPFNTNPIPATANAGGTWSTCLGISPQT